MDAGRPDSVVDPQPDEERRRDVAQPRSHDADDHGLRYRHHGASSLEKRVNVILHLIYIYYSTNPVSNASSRYSSKSS